MDHDVKVVDLATPSDLTLIVGDYYNNLGTVIFKVEKSALRRVSPVFRNMFDSEKSSKENSAGEVSLPEDDPTAMEILLRVAHLSFYSLEGTWPNAWELPIDLATLCAKYDCAEAITPFVGAWLDALFYCCTEPPLLAGSLHAAWMFGHRRIFSDTLRKIIMTYRVDGDRLINDWHSTNADHLIPPVVVGIFSSIMRLFWKETLTRSRLRQESTTEDLREDQASMGRLRYNPYQPRWL